MNRNRAGAALAVALSFACASSRPRDVGPGPDEQAPREPEVGLASYYSRSLQGHRTASGERYDGRAMTCAHRSHPFGTVLRVTSIESGKSVLVRVTDRGPFTPGRVIDLSLAAARKLEMTERGVARVRVERVE